MNINRRDIIKSTSILSLGIVSQLFAKEHPFKFYLYDCVLITEYYPKFDVQINITGKQRDLYCDLTYKCDNKYIKNKNNPKIKDYKVSYQILNEIETIDTLPIVSENYYFIYPKKLKALLVEMPLYSVLLKDLYITSFKYESLPAKR